jgi:hypothetical protein
MALLDVMRDEYVDAHGAAIIAGVALQTLHNLKCDGRVPDPVGQLRYIGRDQLVYRRSDIETWAAARKRRG